MLSLADEILFGTKESVTQLIEDGADINEMDDYGYTPLIESVIANKIDIAKLLLEYGADVNGKDATGRTALHWATDSNYLAFTKLLLAQNADPNAYTISNQPLLVNPLLRNQKPLKKLLYQFGADINFAQDFINTKLLAHRFELIGIVDIINSKGKFIELDFEGFFLEFTVDIIRNSLVRYSNNFAARNLRPYFERIQNIIHAFTVASELLTYQHYTLEAQDFESRINELINDELLFIPIAYEGHAISIIQYSNIMAKIDRSENSKRHGTAVIYRLNKPNQFNPNFVKFLLFDKLSKEFVDDEFYQALDLTELVQMPIDPQLTGNCSWANIEASIPTLLFLLLAKESPIKNAQELQQTVAAAMHFHTQWLEWDKDRALDECVQSFYRASPARKASKAAILGAVLFQACHYTVEKDIERAEKILSVLTIPEYQYILKSYVKAYWTHQKTPEGENLVNILDICGVKI